MMQSITDLTNSEDKIWTGEMKMEIEEDNSDTRISLVAPEGMGESVEIVKSWVTFQMVSMDPCRIRTLVKEVRRCWRGYMLNTTREAFLSLL